MHFILRDGRPVDEPDVIKWAQWMEANDRERIVEQTTFSDGCMVSTVFLGLDHDFMGTGAILYETMTFGGPHGEGAIELRYRTREEAEQGHAATVAAHERL
jgi:hypothetical protein